MLVLLPCLGEEFLSTRFSWFMEGSGKQPCFLKRKKKHVDGLTLCDAFVTTSFTDYHASICLDVTPWHDIELLEHKLKKKEPNLSLPEPHTARVLRFHATVAWKRQAPVRVHECSLSHRSLSVAPRCARCSGSVSAILTVAPLVVAPLVVAPLVVAPSMVAVLAIIVYLTRRGGIRQCCEGGKGVDMWRVVPGDTGQVASQPTKSLQGWRQVIARTTGARCGTSPGGAP